MAPGWWLFLDGNDPFHSVDAGGPLLSTNTWESTLHAIGFGGFDVIVDIEVTQAVVAVRKPVGARLPCHHRRSGRWSTALRMTRS